MKPSIPPVLIIFALVCFALVQNVQAVSPPPDGGYPGGNTAEGTNALFSRTTGIWNTALGSQALFNDINGGQNTGTGFQALFSNTDGNGNTAYGAQALYNNTTGYLNVAGGFRALYSNITGRENTAIGFYALLYDTTGDFNTAIGGKALWHNTAGGNTAVGFAALGNTTDGSGNIALGGSAGGALTTGENNIYIGNLGPTKSGFENNTIRIGDPALQTNTFVAGINGVTVSGGTAVYINSDGQLGTNPSSARFKEGIKPMGESSEGLYSLQPVTFRYKKKLDPSSIPQFGLVAEDVEKVNPDLVVRDKEDKPYAVRYEAVNAMLLNEFLKEHEKTEKLEATVASLIATVKEQAAQIQKVSAQLEATKFAIGRIRRGGPAPQVVNNP
jgi:trimeric autotransporter adhesin